MHQVDSQFTYSIFENCFITVRRCPMYTIPDDEHDDGIKHAMLHSDLGRIYKLSQEKSNLHFYTDHQKILRKRTLPRRGPTTTSTAAPPPSPTNTKRKTVNCYVGPLLLLYGPQYAFSANTLSLSLTECDPLCWAEWNVPVL